MRHRPTNGGAIVLLVLVTVGLAVAPVAAVAGTGVQANGTQQTNATQTDTAQSGQPMGCDYSTLYDDTIDSVVSVRTTTGLGSGFVYQVGANGSENATGLFGETDENASANASYVVTNAHVVGDASSVTVQFTREESRTGTVVGTDPYTDLAVVRVNETPGYVEALPVNGSHPEHGRPVAALGNPFGFEETITHGIVSGVNRSMPTQQGYAIPNTVQTDAPISSGNSGGPLISCEGEVIGVNTAGIAARGAENIGFAVSSTIVERVVPELIETGDVAHARLGVRTAELTPTIVEANDLNVTSGAMVVTVDESTPAADVLQGATGSELVNRQRVPIGGDVIVAVDGRPVQQPEDLGTVLVTEKRPGDEVTLTIVRDGERMNVTTTLVERPDPSAGPTTGVPDGGPTP